MFLDLEPKREGANVDYVLDIDGKTNKENKQNWNKYVRKTQNKENE